MINFLSNSQDAEAKEDLKLCKKAIEGELSAFEALAKKYRARIMSIGMSFFKNADDAEDFLQEVLIKVYLSLKSFCGKSRFSTWLTKIAYNTAINSVKRQKTYLSLAENFERAPHADSSALLDHWRAKAVAETPEDAAIKEASVAAIREAVTSLPEPYRVCIDFFFFYNMSYKEIAETAGIPLNTVRSHIFRAKKILRRHLDAIK